MIHDTLSVAVPWSLSHYIPLNGFHPLYRALYDHVPDKVALSAWDNGKLYSRFQWDEALRRTLLSKAEEYRSDRFVRGSVAAKYMEHFWPPNQVLTTELIGNIEFHHTAPFPSLKRPFVLHCESFIPVLFPFAQQGSGSMEDTEEIREHYQSIFADPLCLGIFSHIPETLHTFRLFFNDPLIAEKLFPSKIGLSLKALHASEYPEKKSLSRPRFLFINSANQNATNFFRRGGHIVLRFWKKFVTGGRDGLLMIRCEKPSDEALLEYGVDVSLVKAESGRSIIWAQDYLASHEMNALMASAHFFLLPSASLHSVSIMEAMLLGTVPVVSDTVGTSVYVIDDEDGIVLHGVRRAVWHNDEVTGIPIDRYGRTPDLDDSLVQQLTLRVCALVENPNMYWDMRTRVLSRAQDRFSGQAFAQEFWSAVSDLYQQRRQTSSISAGEYDYQGQSLHECRIHGDGWARVFESPPQAMVRINSGQSIVWELGGTMIHAYGNPKVQLNDWSVLAQYYSYGAPALTFANTLEELDGKYFPWIGGFGERTIRKLISSISTALKPFPVMHDGAAWIYSIFLRYLGKFKGKWTIEPDIELLHRGVSGYNVIRYRDCYYAILQHEGEFILEKAKSGGYSSCFSAKSVAQVLSDINTASSSTSMPFNPEEERLRPVLLIVEGFHGFNIFRQGNEFFGILAKDGPFLREKLQNKQYKYFFSGFSIVEIQAEILSFVNVEDQGTSTGETFADQAKSLKQGSQ